MLRIKPYFFTLLYNIHTNWILSLLTKIIILTSYQWNCRFTFQIGWLPIFRSTCLSLNDQLGCQKCLVTLEKWWQNPLSVGFRLLRSFDENNCVNTSIKPILTRDKNLSFRVLASFITQGFENLGEFWGWCRTLACETWNVIY